MNHDLADSQRKRFGSTCYSMIERAQGNDGVAWRKLVKLYTPLVLFWCRQSGLASGDSTDVTQEVFLAAYKSLKNFSTEEMNSSFRGWLRTVARRRIADFCRCDAKQVVAPSGGSSAFKVIKEAPDIIDVEISEEKQLLYRQALNIIENEFQEKHQQAFIHLVVYGWKASDVAEKFEMTPNAVFMARHHILKRLRREFHELLE